MIYLFYLSISYSYWVSSTWIISSYTALSHFRNCCSSIVVTSNNDFTEGVPNLVLKGIDHQTKVSDVMVQTRRCLVTREEDELPILHPEKNRCLHHVKNKHQRAKTVIVFLCTARLVTKCRLLSYKLDNYYSSWSAILLSCKLS